MKYCRFGIPLLSNLSGFYREAPVKIKQKLLGSIFSAKLHFREDSYRTTPLNLEFGLILGYEDERVYSQTVVRRNRRKKTALRDRNISHG